MINLLCYILDNLIIAKSFALYKMWAYFHDLFQGTDKTKSTSLLYPCIRHKGILFFKQEQERIIVSIGVERLFLVSILVHVWPLKCKYITSTGEAGWGLDDLI